MKVYEALKPAIESMCLFYDFSFPEGLQIVEPSNKHICARWQAVIFDTMHNEHQNSPLGVSTRSDSGAAYESLYRFSNVVDIEAYGYILCSGLQFESKCELLLAQWKDFEKIKM